MSNALPAGWAMARIAEVIEGFQPGFASGEKNVEGGVAHLRMNNIGLDGDLVLDLLHTVPEKLAKSRHDLCRGNVLVCTTNSGSRVGSDYHSAELDSKPSDDGWRRKRQPADLSIEEAEVPVRNNRLTRNG